MTNLTERVAKALVQEAFPGAFPADSPELPFAAKPYEGAAQAALTEIFNYLENPSIEALNAAVDSAGLGSGMSWSNRSPQSASGTVWKAMLAQFKEEALGK